MVLLEHVASILLHQNQRRLTHPWSLQPALLLSQMPLDLASMGVHVKHLPVFHKQLQTSQSDQYSKLSHLQKIHQEAGWQ